MTESGNFGPRIRRFGETVVGGLGVTIAIFLHRKFMGPAVLGLNIGLVISYLAWLRGVYPKLDSRRVGSLYLVGIAIQCLHACEEYLTDFHATFPEWTFGYRWSDRLFVAFNLIWLCIFVLTAWGVFNQVRLAYLVVWFFALVGGVGNGIFHPVLSMIWGGYFPGLITSLAHLVVGILLVKELVKAR
jgi:hypothetical protein